MAYRHTIELMQIVYDTSRAGLCVETEITTCRDQLPCWSERVAGMVACMPVMESPCPDNIPC